MGAMKEFAEKVILHFYNDKSIDVKDCGGGYYGKVILACFSKTPYRAIIKFYFKKGLCEREKLQLEVLSRHSILKVPETYFMYRADENVPYDALVMEYIEGRNAGRLKEIPQHAADRIAEGIVDNLIVLHRTIHPEGFGELNATCFVPDWRIYYKEKVDEIIGKAEVLFEKGRISRDCISIAREAYNKFDKIFYLPITKASLIHGDYNTWNIILNNEATEAVAVIDPYNCCYGDSEFDLYQLNNANGKEFGLLEKYKKKQPVSENFELKMAFYELFTELMHYYDSDVIPNRELVDSQATRLKSIMDMYMV